MQIVPTVYAPLDPAETARAVADAFTAGAHRPPLRMIEILLALIWFETNGHPPLFGIGNIAAAGFVNGAEVSHWGGLAWRPPWFDEPGDDATDRNRELHAEMLLGHEPSAFRGYHSLSEAAQNWRDLLLSRFPKMVDAAATGDLGAFSRAYTDYAVGADPHAVELALKGRAATLRAGGAFEGLPVSAPSGGGSGVPVLLALGAAAAVGVWLFRRAA